MGIKINPNNYNKRKILVLGLAKSGLAAARILSKLGAIVVVNDVEDVKYTKELEALALSGVKFITGSHPDNLLENSFDLIVKNPGIPYYNPVIIKAMALNIPIITEVELAYELSPAPFIAITGTNGKTTTTTLINEMLQKGAIKSVLAGNIGEVACEAVQGVTEEQFVVIELSSFQLMGINKLKPHISVLTNISPAHLDYHGTMDNYVKAKLNLFKRQTREDFIICNAKNIDLLTNNVTLKAQVYTFILEHEPTEKMITTYKGSIFFEREKIISLKEVNVPGTHGIENILVAIGVAKLMLVSNECIKEVVRNFFGVKHRLQFVREVNGRFFYNDSKATNEESAKAALLSFPKEDVILLAGGVDRGIEFSSLKTVMHNVKVMVVFGEAANKLDSIARDLNIKAIKVKDVKRGVEVAYELARNGDIILLSPACASWDAYKSFEERGDCFIDAVNQLN